MKTRLALLAIAAFATMLTGCSGARRGAPGTVPVETVTAEGLAPIVNGDEEGAKKTSLHEALKSALSLVVGVYVSQEAMVSKAILIDDTITSQTEGYIERYEVLRQTKEGGFYKTKIKAQVRKEDLTLKLRQLENEPQKLGNPILGFNITESADGTPQETEYSALELKDKFSEAGFMTGEKDKADILLKGTVRSDFNTKEGLGGFISYRASLSISAIRQTSGETLAAVQETAGGIDLTESGAARAAIINSAKKAAVSIKDKLLRALREKTTVRITARNAAGFNEASALIRSLRTLPAIRDCWLRSSSDGTAIIDAAIKRGNASDIASAIKNTPAFPAKVIKTTSYEIELEMTVNQ